jgi:hypothetical protein
MDTDNEFSRFLSQEISNKAVCNIASCEYAYVYVVKHFITPKSKNPISVAYVISAQDTHKYFNCCEYIKGHIKIEYTKICKCSSAYSDAEAGALSNRLV